MSKIYKEIGIGFIPVLLGFSSFSRCEHHSDLIR